MGVTLDSVVTATRDQVSCDLAGEAAILHLRSGTYYGLNAIGARIWALLQQPTSVAHVRENMGAAQGHLPDEKDRRRMAAYVEQL